MYVTTLLGVFKYKTNAYGLKQRNVVTFLNKLEWVLQQDLIVIGAWKKSIFTKTLRTFSYDIS